MRILRKSRHWLTPLSALLLSSSAAVMASTAINNNHSPVTLTTSDEGELHLQVSHKAMSGAPDNLKDALLEVIHNDQTHQVSPEHIDPEGKAHYLVQLGLDEAGTEIRLKPISTATPLTDIASILATSTATLLTLKIADVGYNHLTNGNPFPFGTRAEDNFGQSLLRNYARQSILLSAFGSGEAISSAIGHQLDVKPQERTTWKDAIPGFSSSLIMGLPSWFLHDSKTPWIKAQKFEALGSLYAASSTTNTLSLSLRKLHEAGLNDLTNLEQHSISRLSQAFTIVESALILAAADKLDWAKPGLNNGTSWLRGAMANSMAVTLIYNVRDLTADLATDWLGGHSLGNFLAAAPMAIGSSLLHLWGDGEGGHLNMGQLSYRATIGALSAEAAGASLGFGLQKLINNLADGDGNATPARLARIGSTALAGLALKGIANRFGAYQLTTLSNIIEPMGDGVIITNTLDLMLLLKDTIIEPWVVTPLLKGTGLVEKKQTPVVRLQSQSVRRPLLDV